MESRGGLEWIVRCLWGRAARVDGPRGSGL